MVAAKMKKVAGLKVLGFPSFLLPPGNWGGCGTWSGGQGVDSGVSRPESEAWCSHLRTVRASASSRTCLSLGFPICKEKNIVPGLLSYCCITNPHAVSSSEQNPFISSQLGRSSRGWPWSSSLLILIWSLNGCDTTQLLVVTALRSHFLARGQWGLLQPLKTTCAICHMVPPPSNPAKETFSHIQYPSCFEPVSPGREKSHLFLRAHLIRSP